MLNFTMEQVPDTPTPLTHVGDGKFLLPSPTTNQLFSFEENSGHTYLKVEAVTEKSGFGLHGGNGVLRHEGGRKSVIRCRKIRLGSSAAESSTSC